MAFNRLFPADYVFQTLDGQDPAAAGVVYFYTNNTNNLATVYTDAAGATPASNPLTLGSDGRLPNEVFSSATLRVKLLDSLGAQIFQKDDVASSSADDGSDGVGFIHTGSGAISRTVQDRLRDTRHVTDHGAIGDGSTDDRTEFNAMAADYIVPPGTYRIISNLTISYSVQFLPGAKLSIDSGVTVTFTKQPLAGDWQIFSGSGAVAGLRWCSDIWWGAAVDDSTDDVSAAQKAANSMTKGTLYLPTGFRKWSSAVTVPARVSVIGAGKESTKVTLTTDSHGILLAAGADDIRVADLWIYGSYVATDDDFHAVTTESTAANDNFRVENCRLENMVGEGVNCTTSDTTIRITGNDIVGCRNGISLFKGSTRATVMNNTVTNCRSNGIQVDDATAVDSSGTSSPNTETIIMGNHVASNCQVNSGAGIVYSGSRRAVISNNTVKANGVTGSVVAWGIICNSGQDDFNLGSFVSVVGNVISENFGAGGIKFEGVRGSAVVGNTLYSNWVWNSVLSTCPEIDILHDGTNTTQVNHIGDNVIWNPGGGPYADIGIRIAASVNATSLGANQIVGITTDVDNNASTGVTTWRAPTMGTKPSWDAGFRGRVHFDTNDDKLYVANASAWVVVGTQS